MTARHPARARKRLVLQIFSADEVSFLLEMVVN
jgi:hypothetical protein